MILITLTKWKQAPPKEIVYNFTEKQTAEKLGILAFSSEDVNESDGLAPLDDPIILGKEVERRDC